MAPEAEVEQFLRDFFVKYGIFNILFTERTNPKNAQTLLQLEISPAKRRTIIESITVKDYVDGPITDQLYGISSLWVFGKAHGGKEIYIKISLGHPSSSVLCISFHVASHKLKYPKT
ncbi:type II toxin-antitoxin system MqsR family toxin [Dyadobacter sp. 32]|uniref:type II toxin-antitoxin system MqsR family toxin n=1 Tax=Dyadobacter sp. 32 TaxID=538966 RepID=UPI0011EBA7CB